ncbi:DUF5681 domain-containing protein [Bradyrhizobium tropiciagri]|uniref:DUF5681 domain-containing protein n=1 Tax=Bradyrhizobium tropiciagri TaxID=312253 RepID=UPI00067A97F8|nr:DUF5681 domain-containing protein [Bradyrhizobium tropiciagri]
MSKNDDEASGGESEPHETYEVGYGKPPKATRFGVRAQPLRPGRRRDKQRAPDVAALLDRPIEARIDGKITKLHPHEAVLHGLFKRVVAGEIRAIKLFLEQCKRAKLLDPPPQIVSRSVIVVPDGIPMPLAAWLFKCAGPPPWDGKRFELLRDEYERDVASIEQLKEQAKAIHRSAMDQGGVHDDQA